MSYQYVLSWLCKLNYVAHLLLWDSWASYVKSYLRSKTGASRLVEAYVAVSSLSSAQHCPPAPSTHDDTPDGRPASPDEQCWE